MSTGKKILICVCCFNPTLTSRFISFLGFVASLTMITVLVNEKNGINYNNSRFIALALGLDWQHLYFSANATLEADPEGKLISSIVITYSLLYMAINLVLLFGTITNTRWCALLWICIEILSIVSKIGAVIFHLTTEGGELKRIFFLGSAIYIIITMWCCIVIYTAQSGWKYEKRIIFHYEFWNSNSDVLSEIDDEAQDDIITILSPSNIDYDIV